MIVGFIVVDANENENENGNENGNENVEHSQSILKEREVMYFDNESNEDNIYEHILKIMEKNYYQYDKFKSDYNKTYITYKTYELEKKNKFNVSNPIPIPIPIPIPKIYYAEKF
jgi:hypothetical protein